MNKKEVRLFEPTSPRERWHPNFARLHEHATQAERDVLEDWAKGFQDRDGKFVVEFQTTFNSSFWELYLYALMKESGCEVDMSHSRPDFVVRGGPMGPFVGEAVIASNADGLSPEWAAHGLSRSDDREVLLEEACRRLSQAIDSKSKKWNEYEKLPHCRDQPYIICVAPFEQPGAHLQGTQAIDRVLYGGPGPLVDGDSRVTTPVGWANYEAVFKGSGARISLGLFTDARMDHVSAVLFSSLATWGKVHALARPPKEEAQFVGIRSDRDFNLFQVGPDDYAESLADGAHLFINPQARRPIDPDPWFQAGLCTHRFSAKSTVTRLQESTLIQRSVRRFLPAGSALSLLAQPWVDAGLPQRHRPPDGVFYGGLALLGDCDSVELTLHRGWTIAVGRDAADKDWECLFKVGIFLSIQEFITGTAPYRTGYKPTRDEALVTALTIIDQWHIQAGG